ncbi:hypothetical protein [Kocuria massiliensis]|uniref:hypothetical protein n=1 Tax=Kocuria massiliensis TaxID=1926282 RepID=UPI0022B9CDFB|nr:hypothetical protein [Kocuria massiliensis]
MARHLSYVTTLHMPPQDVWNRVGPALDHLGGRASTFVAQDVLKNDTGWSAASWGEVITISLEPGPAFTTMTIRSENSLATQLSGMGRHRKNIHKILEAAGLNHDPGGRYTKGF